MISARLSRPPAQVAVLVRLVAFLLAAASVVVIPLALAAAAANQLTVQAAFTTAGIAAGITLLATLAARSLDPLRH